MSGKTHANGRYRRIRMSLFPTYILNEFVIRCAVSIVSLAWNFWVIIPHPLTDLNTINDYNITPIWGFHSIKSRVFMQHKTLAI